MLRALAALIAVSLLASAGARLHANPSRATSLSSAGSGTGQTKAFPLPPDVQTQRTVNSLSDVSTRKGFIRKVYAIFCTQMSCTIATTAVLMTNPRIAGYLVQHFVELSLGSFAVSSAAVFALILHPTLRFRPPWNMLLVGLHALAQSLTIGTFASLLSPRLVCLGTVHTLMAFVALTLYSLDPRSADLTVLGNVLLTSLTSLTVGVLLNIFFRMPLLDNLISGALAVLSAAYIAYDTKMIVGGRHHKYAYDEKEYILAAMNLYQDVLQLFVQILKILHKLSDKDDGK